MSVQNAGQLRGVSAATSHRCQFTARSSFCFVPIPHQNKQANAWLPSLPVHARARQLIVGHAQQRDALQHPGVRGGAGSVRQADAEHVVSGRARGAQHARAHARLVQWAKVLVGRWLIVAHLHHPQRQVPVHGMQDGTTSFTAYADGLSTMWPAPMHTPSLPTAPFTLPSAPPRGSHTKEASCRS
jgi:hypothetical protein